MVDATLRFGHMGLLQSKLCDHGHDLQGQRSVWHPSNNNRFCKKIFSRSLF